MLDDVEVNEGKFAGLVIDLRSDYFQVFHSLSSHIGRMNPDNAAKIVEFYMNCKAIIDSTRPDGPSRGGYSNSDAKLEFGLLLQLIRRTLHLGDQIVQMPKASLAGMDHQ